MVQPVALGSHSPNSGCVDTRIRKCPAGADSYDRLDNVAVLQSDPGDKHIITLPALGSVLDTTPVALNSYGAGYLRIVPAAGVDAVNVGLKAKWGSPKFRVFTANAAGEVSLVPACDSSVGLVGIDRT